MTHTMPLQKTFTHNKLFHEHERTDPPVTADVRAESVTKLKAIDNWENEGGQIPSVENPKASEGPKAGE